MISQNIRFALRSIVRRPLFSGVVILTLALSIGANATIFSVVHALFFRSLPVEDPDRLVAIYNSTEEASPFGRLLPMSYPNFEDIREQAETLDGAYVVSTWPVSVLTGDRPDRALASFVSAAYFDVLGVRPALGRGFLPEEDAAEGAAAVAVLTHAFWQERFGGRADVLGSTFSMNSRRYTVVGVAPPEFRGTSATLKPDFWVPVSMFGDVPRWGAFLRNRGARFFFAAARLAPGRAVAEASSELEAIGARLAEQYPELNRQRGLEAVRLRDASLNPNLREVVAGGSTVLLGMVTVILLIACMNIANLLLARALGRRQEMAVRASLGAGRGQLVTQLLTESLVLFGLGGLGGVILANVGAGIASTLRPPLFSGGNLEVTTDPGVILYTGGITLAAALMFGLIPAVRASRVDAAAELRDRSRAAAASGSRWLRSGLVGGQVALSLVALIGAGLFLRGLQRAKDIDPGFQPEGVTILSVDLGAQGYTPERGLAFFEEALTRIGAVPGVESVGVTALRPLQDGPVGRVVREDEDLTDPLAGYMVRTVAVSAGFLQVAGIRLLRGRGFLESDRADAQSVAVVNRRLAELFWPGEDAVGHRLFHAFSEEAATVVGVVATGRYVTLAEDPQPVLYLPLAQSYTPTGTFFYRASTEGGAALPAVRRALASIDPELPVFDIEPAERLVDRALWNVRAITLFVMGFGALGLTLAAIGIYGVVAGSVRERSAEIGIRMALGANPSRVLAAELARVLSLLAAGTAVGLLIAWVLGRTLAPQLYGISSTDPLTYAIVAASLLMIASLAAWFPARRATRVDPALALRLE